MRCWLGVYANAASLMVACSRTDPAHANAMFTTLGVRGESTNPEKIGMPLVESAYRELRARVRVEPEQGIAIATVKVESGLYLHPSSS